MKHTYQITLKLNPHAPMTEYRNLNTRVCGNDLKEFYQIPRSAETINIFLSTNPSPDSYALSISKFRNHILIDDEWEQLVYPSTLKILRSKLRIAGVKTLHATVSWE